MAQEIRYLDKGKNICESQDFCIVIVGSKSVCSCAV